MDFGSDCFSFDLCMLFTFTIYKGVYITRICKHYIHNMLKFLCVIYYDFFGCKNDNLTNGLF